MTALDLRAEVAKLVTRVDFGENLRRRAVQDTLAAAQAVTWRRTAERLEWARPRFYDYRGQATVEEYHARDVRLAAQAEACRHKAELLELGLLDFEGIA